MPFAAPRTTTRRPAAALAAVAASAALALAADCSGAPAPASPAAPETAAVPGHVTFARDVAPIVFRHCAPCHRPGEAAPFPLLAYADVRRRAGQIADVVANRYMPPWLPDPGPFPFEGEDERRLTEAQIATLARWAALDAPEGDPADLPPAPRFVDGWRLGEPDLVVEMAEPYVLPAGGGDVFRHFVLPTELAELRYVRGFELRPGNKRVVHHGVTMVDRTWASARKDALDPEPGFDGMIPTAEARIPDGHLLSWLPGSTPRFAPPGMAWRLHPGADLVIQLHMLPGGKPEPIRPAVGLWFADEPPTEQPFMLRLGSKSLDIPPGIADYTVRDRFALPVDAALLGIYPHAHYLGRSMTGAALLPDGRRLELLRIRDWDFNWQDQFRYAEPIPLPRGTVLEMEFVYDNTAANPRNPHVPPRRVVYGTHSSDEMADLSFQLLPESPADHDALARAFAAHDLQATMAGARMRVERDPGDADACAELAVCCVQLGRGDEALQWLARALERNPRHAHALYYLGTLQGMGGDVDGALETLGRALEADPWLVDAMTNLAALRVQRGEVEEALALYRRAIERRPDLIEARLGMADTLLALGRAEEAVPHLRAVVQQQPEDAEARRRLARLAADPSN